MKYYILTLALVLLNISSAYSQIGIPTSGAPDVYHPKYDVVIWTDIKINNVYELGVISPQRLIQLYGNPSNQSTSSWEETISGENEKYIEYNNAQYSFSMNGAIQSFALRIGSNHFIKVGDLKLQPGNTVTNLRNNLSKSYSNRIDAHHDSSLELVNILIYYVSETGEIQITDSVLSVFLRKSDQRIVDIDFVR